VDSVAALGADHIKVRNWPDTATGRALVERARVRGLQVVGHGNEPFPRTGVATLEHGIWPPLRVSEAARDSLWRSLAAGGTAMVPTLVTWPIRLDPPDTLIARIDAGRIAGQCYVPAAAVKGWRDQLLQLKQEPSSRDWREVYRGEVRNAGEMHRAGVVLLAGTDIGAPLLVPGFSLHDELALLVRDAGMTPLQALQAATIAPARAMGLTDSLGTVEAGRLADLVLLDADPLADIRNTRRIHAVVANGRWTPPRSPASWTTRARARPKAAPAPPHPADSRSRAGIAATRMIDSMTAPRPQLGGAAFRIWIPVLRDPKMQSPHNVLDRSERIAHLVPVNWTYTTNIH